MSPELIEFIKRNKDLMGQNSKENWKKIYAQVPPQGFTDIILNLNINPLNYLQVVPYAYLRYSDIEEISLPNNILEIDEYAFKNCKNLKYVKTSKNLTHIDVESFCGCSSLEYIDLPVSIQSIGEYAFDGCKKLKFIDYEGTRSQWVGNVISTNMSTSSIYIKCIDGFIRQQYVYEDEKSKQFQFFVDDPF